MAECLAIDLGASGGRHILGRVENGRLVTREVHRFENRAVMREGRLCWDIRQLYSHLLAGLSAARATGDAPAAAGIDTWGVDFVLLDKNDCIIGDAVAYRDRRTEGADALVERRLPFGELYARTGIQKQPFNSIYQLMSLLRDRPDDLERAESLLMIPDYLNFLLCGVKAQEYTNATTTGLVNALTGSWDYELIERLGLPARLFGPLSAPGTRLGPLVGEARAAAGFDCDIVLPATHDTGSAYLAIPAPDDASVFLSSGTWSLPGADLPAPLLNHEAMRANFTNEGGYGGRIRFLKNIMGLWMIQSIRREMGSPDFGALSAMARDSGYAHTVNVNDPRFLAPDSMSREVRDALRQTGAQAPDGDGDLLRCVYLSLADCYARAVDDLSRVTGRRFVRVNVAGGGSRDDLLNSLTARAVGRPVFAGPVEATAIGNLAALLISRGEFDDAQQARQCVADSFELREFLPQE